jgi:hypothetical protein
VGGFLGKEWLAGLDLGGEGATGPVLVRRVVTGGPDGDVTLDAELAGPSGAGPSAAASATSAALTLTTTYDVALALDTGELAPAVAYMQGRLKAEGHMPTLYALLAATR